MKELMGIINLYEKSRNLLELSYDRTIGTIPFLGKYKLIDFILSSMSNSNIENIGIVIKENPMDLMDYIGWGKEWNLCKRDNKIYYFYPFNRSYSYRGREEIEILKENIEYIYNAKEKYIVIAPAHMIAKVDFQKVLKFHKEKGGQITCIYKSVQDSENSFLGCDTLEFNGEGRVIHIGKNYGGKEKVNISMEMYLMDKQYFIDKVNGVICSEGMNSLKDIIRDNCNWVKVYGYEYTGYLECINSIDNYFKKSLELLNLETLKELFKKNFPVYTKYINEYPTVYGEEGNVENSIICDGAIIEGKVSNCILFPKVHIKKDSQISNSIVMKNCILELGSKVENCILDENVVITKFKHVKGDYKEPLIIEKNSKI